MQAAAPFPRHIAVLILATLACSFAGNHIAARIAFDHDTGLLLAMLCRAGVTLVVLAALVFWRRESLRLSPATWRWQILLGLLIAVQSFCIYSAVARIPVALALLVVNLSPILLALLTWVLGGPRPTRQALAIMGLILFGLVLVLDVPGRLFSSASPDGQWTAGILFSLTAAAVFAVALWVTEHKLSSMAGSVRSMLTLIVVFAASALLGASDLIPGGAGPAQRKCRLDCPGLPGAALRRGLLDPVHLHAAAEHRAQCAGDEHGAGGRHAAGLADPRAGARGDAGGRRPDRGRRYRAAGVSPLGLAERQPAARRGAAAD